MEVRGEEIGVERDGRGRNRGEVREVSYFVFEVYFAL